MEPVIWTVNGWKKQVDRFRMVLLRPFLSGCDFVGPTLLKENKERQLKEKEVKP
jgi:hypothetical protein